MFKILSSLFAFLIINIGCSEQALQTSSQTSSQASSETNIIDLADYQKIKDLDTGRTNKVSLWEHKFDKQKIVVKEPNNAFAFGDKVDDIIEHNIRSINLYFGKQHAWHVKGQKAFAMKYFDGGLLSPEEKTNLIKNKNSPLRTVTKNGLTFTMLDSNDDNYLKLSSGEIIPIDFDYMIIHEDNALLDYHKMLLAGRVGFAERQGADTVPQAVEYVVSSYPKAKEYLNRVWGKEYIENHS